MSKNYDEAMAVLSGVNQGLGLGPSIGQLGSDYAGQQAGSNWPPAGYDAAYDAAYAVRLPTIADLDARLREVERIADDYVRLHPWAAAVVDLPDIADFERSG